MTRNDPGGRDDIDARFADIVAHWDDPPPEATEDDGALETPPVDRAGGATAGGDGPDGEPADDRPHRVDDLATGHGADTPTTPEHGRGVDFPDPRRDVEDSGRGHGVNPPPGRHPGHTFPGAGVFGTSGASGASGTSGTSGPARPDWTADAEAAPDARPDSRSSTGDASGWRVHVPPEDEEETFVPPPPQPLPAVLTDWPFYLALGGLVLGPLALVLLVMLAPTERHLMWVAAGLTMAGFVTLVLRQPLDRDPDDTDDGARV